MLLVLWTRESLEFTSACLYNLQYTKPAWSFIPSIKVNLSRALQRPSRRSIKLAVLMAPLSLNVGDKTRSKIVVSEGNRSEWSEQISTFEIVKAV